MATSEVSICNLALQKLGAARITSLTEDSPNARAMNACYEAMRDRELRSHRWSFAIARAQLAADATAPSGDSAPGYQYTLPADFLRLIESDVNDNTIDWKIEGRKILTDFTAPLEIRYIKRLSDPTFFDALFVDTLACRLAIQTCEAITQSSSKKDDVKEQYRDTIREARRANAIEAVSADMPVDDWDTARL